MLYNSFYSCDHPRYYCVITVKGLVFPHYYGILLDSSLFEIRCEFRKKPPKRQHKHN